MRDWQPLQFFVPGPNSSLSKKSTYCLIIFTFSDHSNQRLKKQFAVLDQLIDRFEKIKVIKYKRKKTFNAKVEETKQIKVLEKTKCIAIREESDIKRRYIDIKKS